MLLVIRRGFWIAPNVFFNKQSICHEEDKRGNRLLAPYSGMFVSNSKEDITIELSALEPGWKIKGSSIKVRKENYEVTLWYNKMHWPKQTYESFTSQHLMGFWRDLIYNFAAVSPLDRKKYLVLRVLQLQWSLPFFYYYYFLRRLLGFPRIFDPSVTQHPFFKSTLLLIICYTAVCSAVTQRSSSVTWRHQKRLCSRLFSLRMWQKTISIWVAFTTQKARQQVDWLINCMYATIKMETTFITETVKALEMTADKISIMYLLFSDYQIKRRLEFARKLSWFSTLLFWNKTRGQDKTIIFLQNKGFPRRRRRPRRNCGVFWKGKFHVINYTRRTLLIN